MNKGFRERLRLFLEMARIQIRRAHLLGVGARDLVLDVGCGSLPNFRANVLCDRFVADARERLHTPLFPTGSRPFIVGEAQALPFADKAFDFVVCSHLLEHVLDPSAVLAELERVAPRGYIEAPSRVAEKMHSLAVHKWFVTVENGRLVLEAKPRAIWDAELGEWFNEQLGQNPRFRPLWMRQWESDFIVQFWWTERIEAEVRGEVKAELFEVAQEASLPAELSTARVGWLARFDSCYGRWLRRHSQPRARDLLSLLACPVSECRGALKPPPGERSLVHKGRFVEATALFCSHCGRRYPIRAGVPFLFPEAAL